MADRIKQYMEYVDKLLESEDEDIDWEEEMKKHLVEIGFFAHERQIHLIVTALFAILSFMAFLYTIGNFSVAMALLCFFLLCLMIPYVKHYFLMENCVQDMYEQYEKMQLKVGRGFERQGTYKR